jgi:hypothetical protein
VRHRVPEQRADLEPDTVEGVLDEVVDQRRGRTTARAVEVARERVHRVAPVAVEVVVEHAEAHREERLVDRAELGPLGAVELLVARREHRERVVVPAVPQVEAVLLDPIAAVAIAPGRALAAEAPSELVERHLVSRSQLLGGGEQQRRR